MTSGFQPPDNSLYSLFLFIQVPSPHLHHTYLESLLEIMDGTQLVCQQTQPHLRDTGILK